MTLAGDGLQRVSLTGGGTHRLAKGIVSDAVWSSHGLVALVRGGWVWVGRPGHGKLRRLARGRSPSFSPDGSELALVRGDYVWIVRVRDGARRRLVRGNSPAWSPSGRQIAYIGRDSAVEIIATHAGRPRRVGSLRGTALDWQPRPLRASGACVPAPDWRVVASSAQAVIATAYEDGGGQETISWYGCLRALGRWRLLDKEQGNSEYGPPVVWQVAGLAGRFAALKGIHEAELVYCSKYHLVCSSGPTVAVYDLSTSKASLSVPEGCGGQPGLCSVDSLAVDSSGFGAWRATETSVTQPPMYAVSCPTLSLCVAVDGEGNALATTTPTGSKAAWSITHVENDALLGVSCASPSLCAAASNDGNVVTSTDPTGGAGAWTVTHLPGNVTWLAISCTAPSLCVAGGVSADGTAGYAAVSNDPTGGAAAWTINKVDNNGIDSVSCPSATLCVAVDRAGNLLTSTNPGGGAATWSSTHIGGLVAVSCPSNSLCVATGFYATPAGENGAAVATSTNPTGGASAWTTSRISQTGSLFPDSVSCPSASLCVAVAPNGSVLTSTNPTGGSGAWTVTDNIDKSGSPMGVSCPSSSLCIAVDRGVAPSLAGGNILHSTDPTGGANAWTTTFVDAPPSCSAAPCTAEQLYAHDDLGTRPIDTVPPGSGHSLANLELSGDSLTLNWTHDGAQRQFALR